jgi:hypothetical protein
MAPHVKHNPDAAVNNIMPIPEKKYNAQAH